ncbi:MAG: helix-turn-helix domain-containing protein [Candidatus Obscuribacterales bacterium]
MTDKSKVQLLSLQATADILGISTKTVRRLLDRREIAFVKVNRRVLVRLSDVEDFVKSRSVSRCEAEQIALEILERF